jgi:hypothetical protein
MLGYNFGFEITTLVVMEGSFCLGIFIILETRVHKASESQLEIMEVVFFITVNPDQTFELKL